MGFKTRTFSITFVLCFFFILDNIRRANGCRLFRDDGAEVNIIPNPPDSTAYVGTADIADDKLPGSLRNYKTENITDINQVTGEESKYLDFDFQDETLQIILKDSYKSWEENEQESFTNPITITLELQCEAELFEVEFRVRIIEFSNQYPPIFEKESYDITLSVPLPAGFTIIGDCGTATIEATDFDYNTQYSSNVQFLANEVAEYFKVSSEKKDGKKWAVSLITTETFRIEEPLKFTLTGYDEIDGDTKDKLSNVTITIIPDMEASTPATPLFENPIHVLDISDGEVGAITSTLAEGYYENIEAKLVHSTGENLEEFFSPTIVTNGVIVMQNKPFSDTELSGNFGVLILEVTNPLTGKVGKTVIHVTLPGNYATPPPTSTTEACIYTTEPTTVCPPCTTEIVTQCPIQTTTSCPEVSCPSEGTTSCPEVSCPPEGTTQCPEITYPPEGTTECPEVTCPSECPEITSPAEGTTQCQECTPCSTEVTTGTTITLPPSGTTEACVCTTVDCPEPTPCSCEDSTTTTTTTSANTCPCDCSSIATESSTGTTETTNNSPTGTTTSPVSIPSSTSVATDTTQPATGTTQTTTNSPTGTTTSPESTPCDCSSVSTDKTQPATGTTTETSTNSPTETTTSPGSTPFDCSSVSIDTTQPITVAPGGSTTPEECTSCPECTTCQPCGDVTVPPETIWVKFRDPEAVVSVYPEETGYLKTMSAFCSHTCKIEYGIKPDGLLSNSLSINPENGRIDVTQNIKENGQFFVTADAEIEGKPVREETSVNLEIKNLQPCENGSTQALFAISVKPIAEGSLTLIEKCDYGNGCECTLDNIIPKEAEEYFSFGKEVFLNKEIDREDLVLFPDQSNTNIILHLEVNCQSEINMSPGLRNTWSKSILDGIGNIKYNVSKTVIVLEIGDVNDNRPQFKNIASPLTVGYPNAETAKQLLPPYLIQVEATDIDMGENAIMKYTLEPNDQFAVHEETGVIYPVAGTFKYEDTHFEVYASDAEGRGKPVEVNVKILSSDNLLVIKKVGSVLEDTDAVLQRISLITTYNIQSLSGAVIASNDDFDDDDDDDNDRQKDNFKSTRNLDRSILQLVIYGLNNNKDLLRYSDIKAKLDGDSEFKSESWTAGSNDVSSDVSSDTGLLAGVIVLSVILVLLLGGAGVAYVLYVRPKINRNKNDYDNFTTSNDNSSVSSLVENGVLPTVEDKSNPLANIKFSDTVEMIEPSPTASPALPRITATEPDPELKNWTVLGDFEEGATDEFKSTLSEEDTGENEEEEGGKSGMTRRKSVVTFNENVERIEIERL